MTHPHDLQHLLDEGLVQGPLFIQTVFGLMGGIGAHYDDVMHMERTADRLFGDRYQWSVLGAGKNQLPISASLGGYVRVRLEDSLRAGPGRPATSNAEQVVAVRQIIEGLGLEVATSDEACELLASKDAESVAF